MFFFFKKRQLVVDCFTFDKTTYELFKMQPARNFYPEWWKNLESTVPEDSKNPTDPFGDRSTMKTCPGIIDHYRNGIIMPFWTEGGFEVGPVGTGYLRVAMSKPEFSSMQHPAKQRGSYLPSHNYSHLKINSPWLFKTKRPVQFTLIKPFWNFDHPEELLIVPGTVNFYYQHATNVNLFVKHEKEGKKIIRLEAGTPIVHWIPQTEDKIIIKNHLVTKQEFEHFSIAPTFAFVNGYAKAKKIREKMRV